MNIRKGMYVLNGSDNTDDYYEQPVKSMYMITDDEDLELALKDWVKAYGYQIIQNGYRHIKEINRTLFKIELEVSDGLETIKHGCFLISIPTAKDALADHLPKPSAG